MSHPAFEFIRHERIESLNITVEEYRHRATRARHFHLAAEDSNNAFLVSFLTVPEDSCGVAHILEHTALCGSQRYPVRDPFFMMTRRSLNTFMNAFTASDWTAYPFASQNRKDFYNLMQVYLDAAFFPHLDELDFAQEGHRLEFATPGDASSELLYKGIVFNEMKGAMSSPIQTLGHKVQEALFPTLTYHHNSGGEPSDIPKLTHAQLKQFHATHYHPSNAVFMTYGDLPVEEHHRYFEDYALKNFQHLPINLHVEDEKRYTAPLEVSDCYALAADEDAADKTHIVLGWLLGNGTDLRELFHAYLLDGVLLDNSASPLRHALETTELGSAASPLCGMDSGTRELSFCAGLEGSSPQHAEAVQELVLKVLQDVADNGVPQEQVEAVLHQLELSQREITGDRMPYGLQLMLHGLAVALHGGDPVAMLNIDPMLEHLRREIQDPAFVPGLVQKMLLDNPHRVRLVMQPDQTLDQRRAEQEKAQLAAIKQALSAGETQRIMAQAAALEERQTQRNDPELLPKVGLDDVPVDLKIAEGRSEAVAGIPAQWYAQGTNGMVYQKIVVDLPELMPDEIDLLPLLSSFLAEVGVGGADYLTMQGRQAAVTGGIHASSSVRATVDDVQRVRGVFTLSGKALARNHAALAELLRDTFFQARFDETHRLRDLVGEWRTRSDRSVVGRASGLVLTAAGSAMNPAGALSNRWGGFAGIEALRRLDDALEQPEELQKLSERLGQLRDRIILSPRQFLIISEAALQAPIAQTLAGLWRDQQRPNGVHPFSLPPVHGQVKQAWVASSQVNFTAKSYPTVPVSHLDAASLMVLGGFLRNGYIHRAVREQGGAYGGGAGYDSDTGAFRFNSYRDPRLEETLRDFDRSLEWLHTHKHEARTLEEAILGVVSQMDRPASPAGEAKSAFFSQLHGRSPEFRRNLRSRILQVTIEDLQRVAARYLQPGNASVAILANPQNAEKVAAEFGLELKNLN